MILLVASLFKMLYHPLRWFAVGAAAAGLPPILIRSVVAIRRLTLDINILMVIAGTGTFFFFFLEVIGGHANFQNQQQYLHANLFFFLSFWPYVLYTYGQSMTLHATIGALRKFLVKF
jgi:hypothetical protein